jgi:NhaP-type Na+/H+ or K+/H+ antiporter
LSALLIPIYDAEGRFDTTGAIFWCIFLAVVAVLISVRVQNITLGKMIRTLREKKAETEETAMPLAALTLPIRSHTLYPAFADDLRAMLEGMMN